MTEAEIEAAIASLDAAIASGTLAVRHGETSHTYQSISDLLKARDHLAGLLLEETISVETPRVRAFRVHFQSGSGW